MDSGWTMHSCGVVTTVVRLESMPVLYSVWNFRSCLDIDGRWRRSVRVLRLACIISWMCPVLDYHVCCSFSASSPLLRPPYPLPFPPCSPSVQYEMLEPYPIFVGS